MKITKKNTLTWNGGYNFTHLKPIYIRKQNQNTKKNQNSITTSCSESLKKQRVSLRIEKKTYKEL